MDGEGKRKLSKFSKKESVAGVFAMSEFVRDDFP